MDFITPELFPYRFCLFWLLGILKHFNQRILYISFFAKGVILLLEMFPNIPKKPGLPV